MFRSVYTYTVFRLVFIILQATCFGQSTPIKFFDWYLLYFKLHVSVSLHLYSFSTGIYYTSSYMFRSVYTYKIFRLVFIILQATCFGQSTLIQFFDWYLLYFKLHVSVSLHLYSFSTGIYYTSSYMFRSVYTYTVFRL